MSRSMCLLTSDRGAGAGAPGAVKDETTASVARDSLKPMSARFFWAQLAAAVPRCFKRLWSNAAIVASAGATAAAPAAARRRLGARRRARPPPGTDAPDHADDYATAGQWCPLDALGSWDAVLSR